MVYGDNQQDVVDVCHCMSVFDMMNSKVIATSLFALAAIGARDYVSVRICSSLQRSRAAIETPL